MPDKEKEGQRAHHLIDTKFGARELRNLGEPELTYLAEVLRGDTLSNYISESSMTRRFEEAAKRSGEKSHGQEQRHVGAGGGGERFENKHATEVIVDPIVHFGAWPRSASTPCRASPT
jgi:hypothetical protein